jgi:5-hydroxyisourate hydrolase-like protein (transthyretin family)
MWKNKAIKLVVCGILCVLLGTNVVTSTLKGDVTPSTHTEQVHQFTTTEVTDETSIICGYVHSSETGDPLVDVDVEQYWDNGQGDFGWNSTTTNEEGFYLLHTAAVTFQLYFYYDDYFREYTFDAIEENEIFWYNLSMIPIPPVTVHIHGFITDNTTGEPIQGADIDLYWYDEDGHYWYNETYSNATGYYTLGGLTGTTYIYVHAQNYFTYYSNDFFLENNTSLWWNVSLFPYPPVVAILCGYITDSQTGEPIVNADVNLNSYVEHGYWHNYTQSNEIGFYSVGVIQGTIHLSVNKQNYDQVYVDNIIINENGTYWVNLTMDFKPTTTTLIKGYVVDNETSSVVRNAFIQFDWKDTVGHFFSKYTFADQKGYYSITAPDGMIQVLITAQGYTNQQTLWFYTIPYEEYWLNTTLTPEITVMFTKPQPGIYINNESKFPLLTKILSHFFLQSIPLIIGPLEITVNITKSTMGCNRVEFYIDNAYKGTDSDPPFTYYWTTRGFFKHTIRVIAYDNAGPCTIETKIVRKLS